MNQTKYRNAPRKGQKSGKTPAISMFQPKPPSKAPPFQCFNPATPKTPVISTFSSTKISPSSELKRKNKERYQQLRKFPRNELWSLVEKFNAGQRDPALVRAVGVAFSSAETEKARHWVRQLLADPDEKIRRYAINAWPKLGGDEAALLPFLEGHGSDREKQAATEALEKIGGPAALEKLGSQKLRAKLDGPGKILRDKACPSECRLNLRCRSGLEGILKEEVEAHGKFRIIEVRQSLVVVSAKSFSLDDVFSLRCFATAGIALPSKKDLAATICSGAEILEIFTEGAPTYRIDFVRLGHQRAAVKELAEKVYARCPQFLNSPSQALWTVAIFKGAVELRPRLVPDPRFAYRADDVAAASHPPLAAAMARLAGSCKDEILWDPFCGSGLELIERARLGGVKKVTGTDLSAEAIEVSKKNFAAGAPAVDAEFLKTDFRHVQNISPTLIITNPPLGKRVPIPDLRRLFEDLFEVAYRILPKGGRLVLINPLRLPPPGGMKLVFQQVIDMGGFNCSLEKYVK